MAKQYKVIRASERLSICDFDGQLSDARDEINYLIEKYGEEAVLDIWLDNFGDEIVVYLRYNRTETDKERDKRLKDTAKARENTKAERAELEDRERAELARLQEKYS